MEELLGCTDSDLILPQFTERDLVIQKQPKSSNECNKTNEMINNDKVNHINTCKVLQRKLELKVEKAKKNYSKVHDIDVSVNFFCTKHFAIFIIFVFFFRTMENCLPI